MMKLSSMASHGYPQGPGLVLHQEQGVRIKEGGSFVLSQIVKQDMVQICSFNLRSSQVQEPAKPVTALHEAKLIIDIDPMTQKPVIINKPDAYLDTELLGFGIAEKCRRHEKILKFLMSGSNELDKGELDLSLLSDLMGLQPVMFGMHQQPCDSYLIHLSSKLDSLMPIPDFFGEMMHNSKVTVNPDGQVVLTACGTEMKDIVSIAAEFYLSSSSTKWRRQSQLVPYFDRKRIMKVRAGTNLSSPQCEVARIAPLKSPKKIKLKPPPKKTSGKLVKERNLYKKNYFHACECLLSLMVDKRRDGRTAILSLKKSGPELPQLLTQFSASIAGTGLAVLFFLICNVACGRVPFDTSELFSTGLAFGLVWLSQAVNRLRDTVRHISKNTSKPDLKEEEMIKRVEKSVNRIYFRAATLMAVAVLRFV